MTRFLIKDCSYGDILVDSLGHKYQYLGPFGFVSGYHQLIDLHRVELGSGTPTIMVSEDNPGIVGYYLPGKMAELLGDNRFGSKCWQDGTPEQRVEWLLHYIESKESELDFLYSEMEQMEYRV